VLAVATREQRAASNQTVFRAANEALMRGEGDDTALHTFICECGEEACMTSIQLVHEEYESVRSEPHLFALAHGHEGTGDAVIEEFERFTLVQKTGDAREIAERNVPPEPREQAGG